jgi:Calpain family cysteine protease
MHERTPRRQEQPMSSRLPTTIADAVVVIPFALALMLGGCDLPAGRIDTGGPDGGPSLGSGGGGAGTIEGNAGTGVGGADAPTGGGGAGGTTAVSTGDGGAAGANRDDAGAGSGGAEATDAGRLDGVAGAGGSMVPITPPAVCTLGLPSSLDDLLSKATGSTVSRATPMGTRYEQAAKHVATMAELGFLRDAHAQPAIPGSTSGLRLRATAVTLYPTGMPTPADVNQHAIGNCDGDTAFASIAYANAPFLKTLIEDHGDATFTVSMYDPLGHRLQVFLDNQFLVDGNGNLGAVSGKNGVADWATVLEKATMKYLQVFPVVADIGGIGSEHQTPMYMGAGGSLAFDRGKLSAAELTRVTKAALAAGKLISGGFGVSGMALPSGMQTVTAHGYAVLVPKSDAVMVSMRNPWGVEPTAKGYDGSTDGVMDIPPDPKWSGTIDLRIIDPGDACGLGVTKPYAPPALAARASAVNVTELHAR